MGTDENRDGLGDRDEHGRAVRESAMTGLLRDAGQDLETPSGFPWWSVSISDPNAFRSTFFAWHNTGTTPL